MSARTNRRGFFSFRKGSKTFYFGLELFPKAFVHLDLACIADGIELLFCDVDMGIPYNQIVIVVSERPRLTVSFSTHWALQEPLK